MNAVSQLPRRIHELRHTILLVVTIIMLSVQPATEGLDWSLIVYHAALTSVLIGAFLVVFKHRRQRRLGLAIGLTALISKWIAYDLSGQSHHTIAVIHHSFAVAFFGYAVAVILRGIFEEQSVQADHVIGAVCGYVFAGVAWGNAYTLAELLSPNSFTIQSDIAAGMANVHTRHFLFNYFSMCTLTGAGYGDITAMKRGVATMTWLEAAFGQLYIAVVIAQLVGLKLAQSVVASRDRMHGGAAHRGDSADDV